MKKTLLLTLMFVILSNCDIKPRETTAQPTTLKSYSNGATQFIYYEEVHNEMKYGVWTTTNYYGGNTTIVNLTKDVLEVELLKLQISELHQRLYKEK